MSDQERSLFVRVELDRGCTHGDGCRICIDACPVDIFTPASGRTVGVQPHLEDECILCNLCVDRCPPRVVRIIKLYDLEEVAP